MDKHEEFAKWYLRLNGYFLVENFVVHAGDDASKINESGLISQHTESDLLGIRFPFQKETSGKLNIANDPNLILSEKGLIDCVVVEVKSGGKATPNRAWSDPEKIEIIKYIVRFFGILPNEVEISLAAESLNRSYSYLKDNIRFRYIIISYTPNKFYSEKGVKYISFDQAINFIKTVRVKCWIDENIGVMSYKQQWGDFINKIFELAGQFYQTQEANEKIKAFLKEN